MVQLSVNVNKVATLRNARDGGYPSVLEGVRVAIAAGAPGITVHPRADQRHIRRDDVYQIAEWLRVHAPSVELNIEGDPRPDWIELVREVRPSQATLVPVREGELTSEAGFRPDTDVGPAQTIVEEFRKLGIRTSVFIDADPEAVRWAERSGADRVELHTEPFARAFERGPRWAEESFQRYAAVASEARARGLGVNAGHDLDLDNLRQFRRLPYLDEVSIGHALVGRALFDGLDSVVRAYLKVLDASAS